MSIGGRRADDAPGAVARVSAAVVLLLAFVAGTLASAAGVHGCPRHHHHHVRGPAGDHGPAAADADRGPDRAGEDRGPGERPSGGTCTCLGDCQAGVPYALHAPSPGAELEPHAVGLIPTVRSPGVRPAPRSEYFLPYPLGPPAA